VNVGFCTGLIVGEAVAVGPGVPVGAIVTCGVEILFGDEYQPDPKQQQQPLIASDIMIMPRASIRSFICLTV